jgi:phage terminase small subunit
MAKKSERTSRRPAKRSAPRTPKPPTTPATEPDEDIQAHRDGSLKNARHEKFCHEFIVDLNATRAYQRAYGASYESALANGPRLIGNDRVAARVRTLQAQALHKTAITAERVIQELARLATVDLRSFFDAQNNLRPVWT